MNFNKFLSNSISIDYDTDIEQIKNSEKSPFKYNYKYCNKCKDFYNYIILVVQTRKCDEGPTIKNVCLNCNKTYHKIR